MSGNDKNIRVYTGSDIEKYLNGDLSAPEMHAMEKAALEDPFLADAIEGTSFIIQRSPSGSFPSDIADLEKRLAARIHPAPARVVTFNWRVAAAVLLLVGLGITSYFTLFNRSTRSIAKSDLVKTDGSGEPSASPQPAEVSAASKDTAPAIKAEKLAKGEKADKLPKDEVKPNLNKVLQSRLHDISISADSTNTSGYIASAESTSIPSGNKIDIRRNAPADQATMFKKADTDGEKYDLNGVRKDTILMSDQLVFTGKVTDARNHALPGASLYVPGHDKAMAVTDRNGNFALRVKKADSVNKLAVASSGYEPGYFALDIDNKNSNIIQLKPDKASLNEVVVSGFGRKRKEVLRRDIDAPIKPVSLIAVPVDGWPAYNNYIESTKKIFTLDSTLAGNETISFIVHQSGRLSSFKVEQSISPAHDSAAIRLIRQGPGWKLMKGRNERAVVSISFP